LCLTQAVDFRRPPAGFAIERHSSFDPRRYDVPAVNPAVKPISLQKRRSQNVFCRASPCQDDSTARLAGWRSYYNRGGTRKGLFDACVFEVHDKLRNQAGGERQAAAIDVSRDFWPGDPANAFHFGNAILGKAIFGQGAFRARRFSGKAFGQGDFWARRFLGKAIFGQRVFARPTLARRIQRRRGSRQCIQRVQLLVQALRPFHSRRKHTHAKP
jgi:hypothetical protein